MTSKLLIPAALAILGVVCTMRPIAATSTPQTNGGTTGNETQTRRVSFHYSPPPGPLVTALIESTEGSSVVVQRQHFLHKVAIGVPFADARPLEKAAFRADLGVEESPDEDLHGWIFRRATLTRALLALNQVFDEEWDPLNPQFSTLMLDLEPHYGDPGASRIAVMNDAIGLCHTILGQRVQVGFQGLPHQRGLNAQGVPAVRIYDSVIANQGAIFIHSRFTKKGAGWFEAGMRLTRALLDRVEPIRDGRPVIAFVWARRSAPAGFALIPDDKLRQQLRLLIDADVEISVFGTIDAETANVIRLARAVMLRIAHCRDRLHYGLSCAGTGCGCGLLTAGIDYTHYSTGDPQASPPLARLLGLGYPPGVARKSQIGTEADRR